MPGARHPRVDALRGLALVSMTAYHFAFDLNHFGYIRQNFYDDPLWTLQRTAIVSLFLFTAGLGQVLAVQAGQGWRRFGRRWGQVAACAALVSLGSWWMFPRSWISFGVLHGMAVMLLLVRAGLQGRALRGASGVKVAAVSGGAEAVGMRAGDVILAVGTADVSDLKQFDAVIAKADKTRPLPVTVLRGDWAQFLRIPIVK